MGIEAKRDRRKKKRDMNESQVILLRKLKELLWPVHDNLRILSWKNGQ